MLQPADVGVLRRQLDRLGALDDLPDRLLRLAHRRLPRVHFQREDRGEAGLHLEDSVGLEDVNRHRPFLGLTEHRRLLAILVLEGHHDVRLVHLAGDDDR